MKKSFYSIRWLVLFSAITTGIIILGGSLHVLYAEPVDDTTPPELIGFDFNPKSIDVSSGPATVTFTLTITDDLSGLDNACFSFYSPSGEQSQGTCVDAYQLIDEENQIYSTTHEFPEHIEAGTWYLDFVYLKDNVTNYQIHLTQVLASMGFPTELTVVSDSDTTPPVLNSLDFNPKADIDAGDGPVNITFTLNVTDDISGYGDGHFHFRSPSGQQFFWFEIWWFYVDENGDCTVTAQLPQYSEIGTWICDGVGLSDNVGNYVWYEPTELENLGFPTTFEVTSSMDDTTPPVLLDLLVEPIVINTIQGPDSATFTLNASDDLSGLAYGDLRVISPSGSQFHVVGFNNPYHLVDGYSNLYQNSLEFQQYSEFGEWVIDGLSLRDKTTNDRSLDYQELVDLGLPVTVLMEGIEHSASFPVGSGGGTIDPEDDDILTIEIPSGAIDEDVEIVISKIGRFEPVDILIGAVPEQGQSIAEYSFEPDYLVFNVPVIVTMTVDVTALSQDQRDSLNIFLFTDTDGDGIDDAFLPIAPESLISIETITNPGGTVVMTFVMELEHFSTYAVILPLGDGADSDPPVIDIDVPGENAVIQDGVVFKATVQDESLVTALSFTLRKANGSDGQTIGLEELGATYNAGSGYWELAFDSTNVLDGYYLIFAEATDEFGNHGRCSSVPFVIRNWAVFDLLPKSDAYRAGRTMPIKFTLRLRPETDPLRPFVYNEDLEILIYETNNSSIILQRSIYGETSRDYRIDTIAEHYITNFKTEKIPTQYTVEIWRPEKEFLIGSFDFETQRK